MTRPELSMRHPHVSLEDTIAMKLLYLCNFGPDHKDSMREIVTDLKSLIRQETADMAEFLDKVEDRLFPPPSVIEEGDVIFDVFSNMSGWSMRIVHKPSGIALSRNSVEFKSQLQAKADALNELEGKVKAWLEASSQKP